MSCHGNNRKRIAIIAGAGAGAAGVITYASLASNPVAAAALPAVLAFAACPAMCAAMGGIMWLNRRISKKKGNAQLIQQKQKTKEEEVSNLESTTEEQQEKLTIAVTGTNDERTISFEQQQQQPQGQRKKRNTPNQEGQKASK
jgi:uncharacterized membrane protein YciS (DUF1049 family)